MIDKILLWTFNVGVLCIFAIMTIGVFGITIPLVYSYPIVIITFIPRFIWLFGIRKDPFDIQY